MSRSFSKIELYMGDEEFTLFFDYLKRYNSYKLRTEPAFFLRGLEDVSATPSGVRGKPIPFNKYGDNIGSMAGLVETVYLLTSQISSLASPVRFELTVVSQLVRTSLKPGHTHHECLSRHPASLGVKQSEPSCRETFHAVGYPWSAGPAFALSMLQRFRNSQLQQAIYGHEYFGLSLGSSILRYDNN